MAPSAYRAQNSAYSPPQHGGAVGFSGGPFSRTAQSVVCPAVRSHWLAGLLCVGSERQTSRPSNLEGKRIVTSPPKHRISDFMRIVIHRRAMSISNPDFPVDDCPSPTKSACGAPEGSDARVAECADWPCVFSNLHTISTSILTNYQPYRFQRRTTYCECSCACI